MIILAEAFEDYCSKKTIKEIAKRHGKTENTIRTWSCRENWKAESEAKQKKKVERHETSLKKYEDSIYEKYIDKAEELIGHLLEQARIGAYVGVLKQRDIYHDIQQVGIKNVNLEEQERVNRMTKTLAGTLKDVIPQISEDLAKEMMQKMEALDED